MRHNGIAVLRNGAWLCMAVIAASATPAATQAEPGDQDQKTHDAYTSAITCFVVAAHAEQERKSVGDQAGAARYDSQAKQAFDTVIVLGHQLGLSNEQMNGDIGHISGVELPHMIMDESYFRQKVATCRGLGLM